MPMYEYICDKCGHTFTEMHRIDDRNIPKENPCPECKAENSIDQLFGAPPAICPIRLGRHKPRSDFVERMKQIKKSHGKVRDIKIKDY